MALKEGVQPVEVGFDLTESGLNVYTSLEILLPVNVQSGDVFDLDLIEFIMDPPFDPVAAGKVDQSFQFTFNEQTAILSFDDNDIIAAGKRQAHASAALLHSGDRINGLHLDTRGRANLIAKNKIFLGMDSVNTTLVWQMNGRLIGSVVKLDQKSLTQLVLSQIS